MEAVSSNGCCIKDVERKTAARFNPRTLWILLFSNISLKTLEILLPLRERKTTPGFGNRGISVSAGRFLTTLKSSLRLAGRFIDICIIVPKIPSLGRIFYLTLSKKMLQTKNHHVRRGRSDTFLFRALLLNIKSIRYFIGNKKSRT